MSGAAEDQSGQVVVVTGGAGGIGSATTELLALQGATVVSIDAAAGQAGPPGASLCLQADVTDAGALRAAGRQVAARFGGCDALIICAGIAVTGPAAETSEEDWDRVFAVNVRGGWLTFREFFPVLRQPARVVTVASAAGLRPLPQLAAYSAAKAALIALTRSIAIDYASAGIRANCVCPGQVDTPLAAQVQGDRTGEARESVAAFRDYLIKRAASPAEIAAAVAFASSPACGYLTGSVIPVDGGRSLH